MFLSLQFDRTYLPPPPLFLPCYVKILVQLFWKNICSPAVSFCAQYCSSFTDYLSSRQLHARISLHLTGALKWDD